MPIWYPSLARAVSSVLTYFPTQITTTNDGLSESFGKGATASSDRSTAVGASATASGVQCVALGYSATASFIDSIAIGAFAATTATEQFVVGATASNKISQVFIGSGVVSTAPGDTTYNASGGSGANVAGGALGLAGGRSTGSGTGGPVTFSTTKATASSSTLNTLTERGRFDSLGNFLLDATAAGTTAERTLALGNTSVVEPTASANLIHLYAKDSPSDGLATLGLYTEHPVSVGLLVATHALRVWLNLAGTPTEFDILLRSV